MDRAGTIATLVLLGWEPHNFGPHGAMVEIVNRGWQDGKRVRAVWLDTHARGCGWGWRPLRYIHPVDWDTVSDARLRTFLKAIQQRPQ